MALTKVTYSMIDAKVANVMDFGAVGNGTTNDTNAFNLAIATGYDIYIPLGKTFAVSGVTGFANNQKIYGGGCLKKYGLIQEPIVLLPDEIDGIWFDEIEFNGEYSNFSFGNPVPAILGYITHSIKVTNCYFHDIIDVGIKLRDGANLYATGNRFYNIYENGVELHNYDYDVRTGNPYTGTRPLIEGNHQIIGNHFEKISREEIAGGPLVDACAVSFFGSSNYPQQNVVVANNVIIDCLRYIWTENNTAGSLANGVVISGNTLQGRVNGGVAEGIYGKAGIGIIGAKNVIVSNNTIRNVVTYNPVGTDTACIIISGSAGIEVGTNIKIINNSCVDDSGESIKTQWGIYCFFGNDIEIIDNTVSGTTNAGGIYIDPNYCHRVACYGNTFTESEYSWNQIIPVIFTLSGINASGTYDMFPTSLTGITGLVIPSNSRMVAIAAELNTPITAGAITITPKCNGVTQTWAVLTQATFGGSISCYVKANPANTTQNLNYTALTVTVATDGSYLPIGSELVVTMLIDIGLKM